MGRTIYIPGALPLAIGLVSGVGIPVVQAGETLPTNQVCLVHADGTLTGPTIVDRGETAGPVRLRQEFGLPQQPPGRRWLEEEKFPVCHTSWEKEGIRYTQSVLATAIQVAAAGGQSNAVPVLLVRLTGECLADEYTDASATYAVRTDVRRYDLILQDGLVYAAAPDGSALLAALDIPSSGIQTNAGPKLIFWAHMPPGTSGSMIIKVPADRLQGEKAVHALQDLDFDEELRRLKLEWNDRPPAQDAWPVRFAD